jgi:cell division transport system permease protein
MTMNPRSPKPAFTAQPDAQSSKRNPSLYESWFALWWQRHRQSGLTSIQKIQRAPFATLLTVLVIGVSLALPALLMVFIKNAQLISAGWGDSTQISLFIKTGEPDQTVQQLINRLQANTEIASVNYISPAQGLQQFQAASGFSNLQNALPANPLPGVLEIKPAPTLQTPEAVQQLVNELQQLPEADVVQLDMQWVNRLFAMLNLAKRIVIGLAVLLGLGVILIIGNTIRLATQNNREEIEIMKLIGATNAFVRRPFLYTGICYGLLGGIAAWLFVEIVFWSLASPIYHVAQAYQTNIQLHGLGFGGTLLLWLLAGLLGLAGSWLVVSRYLNVTRSE